MPALTRSLREAFALAIVAGENYIVAAEIAGYAAPRNYKQLEHAKDVAERIAEIRLARAGGGSREFADLTHFVMTAALGAQSRGTPQGDASAKGLFELVGKLKDRLPDPSGAAAPSAALAPVLLPGDVDLTDAEWMARYGPEAPGGKPEHGPSGS